MAHWCLRTKSGKWTIWDLDFSELDVRSNLVSLTSWVRWFFCRLANLYIFENRESMLNPKIDVRHLRRQLYGRRFGFLCRQIIAVHSNVQRTPPQERLISYRHLATRHQFILTRSNFHEQYRPHFIIIIIIITNVLIKWHCHANDAGHFTES